MSEEPEVVNSIAPLRNVAALAELVVRVRDRASGLPGMGCFYGPSGLGKSCAAMYSANKYKAYHVQVKSVWTRKKLLTSILTEMGINPASTIADMVDQVGEQLSLSSHPLLIDEADILVKKGGMIEVVRDLYESSQGTVILIGEENLPHALKQWERIHGRMMDWVKAEPGTVEDVIHLAKIYAPGIVIAGDLIKELNEKSAGSVRRQSVNLARVLEKAEVAGLTNIDLAKWSEFKSEFFTGNPPPRRTFQ